MIKIIVKFILFLSRFKLSKSLYFKNLDWRIKKKQKTKKKHVQSKLNWVSLFYQILGINHRSRKAEPYPIRQGLAPLIKQYHVLSVCMHNLLIFFIYKYNFYLNTNIKIIQQLVMSGEIFSSYFKINKKIKDTLIIHINIIEVNKKLLN